MRIYNIYSVAALTALLFAAPAAFADSPESAPGSAASSRDSMSPGGSTSSGETASQGMSPGMSDPSDPSAASALDEQTIRKVADAIASVQLIHEDYSQQLQNAQGDEEAQQLQSEAQEKMVDAVQESGLTVEEYNEVVARMNQDPQLRNQILQRAETVEDTQG